MTQRSRGAFSRFTQVLSAVAALLVIGAGSLLAQGESGKIEGTVKDSAGAPIAGAQVIIVGSAFSATTDANGYYFMNNVPASVVTVRAQYIGYTPSEVRNVRVLSGQTMTVNPVLAARALELGAITVTAAQNPIVPRDQVTSKPTVEGNIVNSLPVDRVSQVLALQPGVVNSNRGLSIRGSRPGSQATYIDGVPVINYNAGFTGSGGLSTGASASATTVGTNALEEASVTTGAAGAAYGQAEGGLISMVTQSGGTSYHGAVSYATDNVAGQTYGTGLNRVEASLGGPIFRNFTFYVATTLQGQQNGVRSPGAGDIPRFALNGTDTTLMVPLSPGSATSDSQLVSLPKFVQIASGSGCTGLAATNGTCKSTRLLYNNSDNVTFDGKLQYTFGVGSRVSAEYHLSRNQGMNGYPAHDPLAQTAARNTGQALIGNWSQVISATAGHELALEAAVSWQRDQYISGLVDPSWWENHHDPFANFNFGNIQFIENFQTFPIDDKLIENMRLGTCQAPRAGGAGGCIPFLNRNDLNGGSAYRINPYGVTATIYNSQGLTATGPTLNQETRVYGRADLDWQANRYNRFRAGFDFTNFTDLAFTSNLINQIFMNAYKVSPKVFGLYGQDRIDLGDVVIELGLRYDHLNSGIMYPRVPARTFTDPLRSSALTLAQKLSISYNAQDSSMARACDAAIQAADSLKLSTCNFFKADPVDALSPTLRVSFPVTDRTGFRLSYSHQVNTPDVRTLAEATNTDLANSNTNDIFARPLGFGKTIMFEFGVRHAFSQDMVLDVSAYNKDAVSEISGRTLHIYDPFIGGNPDSTNEDLNLYTNADFGNTRGIDFRLDRRFGSIFVGTISYTYENAKSTGSDPNQYLNTYARVNSAVTGQRLLPPQTILPTTDSRTHSVAGNIAATFPDGWKKGSLIGSILQNGGIYATFSFASGLPYTLLANGGLGILGPGNGFGLSGVNLAPLNSSRMPWIKSVDLRLTRGVRVAGRDVSVFADFHNLFNWKNLTAIFAETGDVVNSLYQNNTVAPQIQNLESDAGTLWLTKTVVVNGVNQTVTGADLSDCSKWQYTSTGAKGAPDCIMLRQDEARWGNGDGFFSTDEVTRAYNAWYDLNHGAYSLYDVGFNMRLGFEINF